MKLRKSALGLTSLCVVVGIWASKRENLPHGRTNEGMIEAGVAPQVKRNQSANREVGWTQTIPHPVLAPSDTNSFLVQLTDLNSCYTRECGYSRTDPRSYDFALGQDIQDSLFLFADHVRTANLERREIVAVGLQFLASADGHVQEAALDLLSTQPSSPEILDAILENIIEGYDAELIDQALVELERYTSRAERAKIDETLARALMTGAPFVAREISLRIAPFLDTASYKYFQDVASRLPRESSHRLLLETSLADFQRRNSAG